MWTGCIINFGIYSVETAITDVNREANQARGAIALVFCVQVMQINLESKELPENLQKELLADLGVRLETLLDENGRQRYLRERIDRWRTANQEFREKFTRVSGDANFRLMRTERDS